MAHGGGMAEGGGAPGSVTESIIPEIGESSKVVLQTCMGTFVSAVRDGGTVVSVFEQKAGDWETFTMTRVDDEETVYFKCNDGKHFLSAVDSGGSVVLANKTAPGGWEKFKISIDESGLIALQTENGHFVRSDEDGILKADAKERDDSGRFRLVSRHFADKEITNISVNVYKIGGRAPFWHTGVVIDGREAFYNVTGKVVWSDNPGKMKDMTHHRTIHRFVPGDMATVKACMDGVISRWDGTRYDVLTHNCNFFTHDVLCSLHTAGLDREYLIASGVASALGSIPGSSVAQELLLKWPMEKKRLIEASLEDLRKFAHISDEVRGALIEALRISRVPDEMIKAVFPQLRVDEVVSSATTDVIRRTTEELEKMSKKAGDIISGKHHW